SPPGGPAGADPRQQAARALPVLRPTRQLRGTQALSLRGATPMAEVAVPPLAARPLELGGLQPASAAPSAPAGPAHSGLAAAPSPVRETVSRGAGCGSPARPDP